MAPLHILKLSVGTRSVADLRRWQARKDVRASSGAPRHVTRMWPRREAEILAGGSIYWVIQGAVLARQRIAGFEEVRRADGIRRCGLILDPALIPVEPLPRRPFQGWRYLAPEDAPPDLAEGAAAEALPPALAAALAEIGVR